MNCSLPEECNTGGPDEARQAGRPLVVTSVGHAVYLVSRGQIDACRAEDIAILAERTAVALKSADLERDDTKLSDAGAAFDSDGVALTLPDWQSPLSDEDIARLPQLRGATLFICDESESFRIDYVALQMLRRLRLSRLVYRDPFGEGFREIVFRYPSKLRRILDLIMLFSRRIAIVRGGIGSSSMFFSRQGGYVSELIKEIERSPDPDAELSLQYLVFEGTRQMPPIRHFHSDISAKGGGRYSIWNQRVIFSSTEPDRIQKRPYWIVAYSEEIAKYLTFVPQAFRVPTINPKYPDRLLKRLVLAIDKNEEGREPSLQPGDPIVVCTHAVPPGGAERQWVYLAQALSGAGYKVTFVTYQPLDGANNHYLPILEKSGIPVLDVTRFSVEEAKQMWPDKPGATDLLGSEIVPEFESLLRLSAGFVTLRPKVIFAQLDHPNILAGLAAHFAGVPRVVLSFRNYNPTHFPYIYNAWFLSAYRLLSTSHRVTFSGNNRSANDDYADWIGIPRAHVSYVPNAIDAEMFATPTEEEIKAVRAELGLGPNEPTIVGAFRLSPEKDPLTFVDVCGQVATSIPGLRAFVVGAGPMQAEIEARIDKLGLRSNVTLLGNRSDVNVLMNVANVFLLTSLKEGMPNVLMEAQMMGVAVVATRSGWTPEVVVDQQTAILSEAGDVANLASSCIALLRDPVLAREMGDAGRRHVVSSFQIQKLGRRYLDLVAAANAPRLSELQPEDVTSFISDIPRHSYYEKMASVKRLSMLHVDTLMLLRMFALRVDGAILEIGPYVGGSTIAIASGVQDGHAFPFVSIEGGGQYLNHEIPSTDIFADLRKNVEEAGLSNYTQLINGHSADPEVVREVYQRIGDRRIGLLFIDADGQIDRDINTYRDLLQPNCIMAFDDYSEPDMVIRDPAGVKGLIVHQSVERGVKEGWLEPLAVARWGTWFGRFRGSQAKKF